MLIPHPAVTAITALGGVSRILTSGHGRTVIDGHAELAHLVDLVAGTGITICAASGVNASTGLQLLKTIPLLRELHLSAGGVVDTDQSAIAQQGRQLGFGAGKWELNPDKLQAFWAAVNLRVP